MAADADLNARPRLIVVGGPNGSGKTALTEQILRHRWLDGCEYVNPDNIARDAFGDWNDSSATLAAAQEAERIREACLAEGRSLAFETVMSAPDKLDFINRAKRAGFFVRLFFVSTTHPSINAARVAMRVMAGGHEVPITKIVSRYSKSIANCAAVIGDVDRGYIYDNSVDGAPAKLLFRVKNGSLAKLYEPELPAWAELIRGAIRVEADSNGPKSEHRVSPILNPPRG